MILYGNSDETCSLEKWLEALQWEKKLLLEMRVTRGVLRTWTKAVITADGSSDRLNRHSENLVIQVGSERKPPGWPWLADLSSCVPQPGDHLQQKDGTRLCLETPITREVGKIFNWSVSGALWHTTTVLAPRPNLFSFIQMKVFPSDFWGGLAVLFYYGWPWEWGEISHWTPTL